MKVSAVPYISGKFVHNHGLSRRGTCPSSDTQIENYFREKFRIYLFFQIRDQLATAQNRSKNSDSENIQYFMFAPVNSCNVEINFSRFVSCLTNRRRSYGFENLGMYVVTHCNKIYRGEQ